jgi:hypothetical protein
MPRGKAPPFKQRFEAAIAVAKAAGATRVKVNPDGSVEVDFKAEPEREVNGFDQGPNPLPAKRGNARA